VKPRNVRISGTHIAARLNDRDVAVLNLSLTGALLKSDEALEVNSEAKLVLARDSVVVTLHTRVLRCTRASDSFGWHVAVTFPDASFEDRKAIPQLVTKSSRGR
jgi:hypothetical protein